MPFFASDGLYDRAGRDVRALAFQPATPAWAASSHPNAFGSGTSASPLESGTRRPRSMSGPQESEVERPEQAPCSTPLQRRLLRAPQSQAAVRVLRAARFTGQQLPTASAGRRV